MCSGLWMAMSAILIAASLVGCGEEIPGEPLAEGVSATYRGELTADHRAELAVTDEIRRLDACGFINDAAVATLGKPAYLGAAQSFNECQVRYRPSVGPAEIYRVKVDLGHYSIGGTTEQLDGVAIRTEKGLGCVVTVPYHVRPFSYWVYTSDGPGGEKDACAEAKAFVRAALPTLKTTPLRSDTVIGTNTPLSRMDPCAVLDIVGNNKPNLRIQRNTNNCDFLLDNKDQSTRYSVTYTQKTLSILWRPDRYEVVDVSGVKAVVSRTGKSREWCKFDLYLGENNPREIDMDGDGPPKRGLEGEDTWVDTVEMSGYQGCDELKRVASVIVGLYRAR